MVRIDKKLISLVYYETGETNSVPMPGSELVPFTDDNVANLKLEKKKNRKLQKAIAAARASVLVFFNWSQFQSGKDSVLFLCSLNFIYVYCSQLNLHKMLMILVLIFNGYY